MEVLHNNFAEVPVDAPTFDLIQKQEDPTPETSNLKAKVGTFFDNLFGIAGKASDAYQALQKKEQAAPLYDTQIKVGDQDPEPKIMGMSKPVAIGAGILITLFVAGIVYTKMKKD